MNRRIVTTENQMVTCKEYLDGKKSADDLYVLFKTYLNEHISIFGWQGWQYDPLDKALDNFCKAVTSDS